MGVCAKTIAANLSLWIAHRVYIANCSDCLRPGIWGRHDHGQPGVWPVYHSHGGLYLGCFIAGGLSQRSRPIIVCFFFCLLQQTAEGYLVLVLNPKQSLFFHYWNCALCPHLCIQHPFHARRVPYHAKHPPSVPQDRPEPRGRLLRCWNRRCHCHASHFKWQAYTSRDIGKAWACVPGDFDVDIGLCFGIRHAMEADSNFLLHCPNHSHRDWNNLCH